MKKLYLFIILLTLLFPCAAYSLSDSIIFTSYYPAPYGVYDNFCLVPKTTGNDYSGSCVNGTLYVNSSGDIQFCKNSVWGPIGGGGSGNSGLWKTGPNNSIYLNPTYTKVYIGLGDIGPSNPNIPQPVMPLHIQSTNGGGIFSRQDVSNNASIPNDAGVKFIWWPKYAALLVGANDQVDWNTSTGMNSIAFGNNCKAPGAAAAAFGDHSVAAGDNSVAIGKASAGSTASVAIGYNASASGPYSVALGTSSSAGTNGNSKAAIAIGKQAVASGNSSVAIGPITVSGSNSVGLSVNNTTSYTVSQANTMAFMGGAVGFGTENPVTSVPLTIGGLTGYALQNPPHGVFSGRF